MTAVARCRSCNAEVIWCMTKDGKTMPVDRAPAPNGNLLIWRGPYNDQPGTGDTMHVRVLAGGVVEHLHSQDVPLRTSHFATCPEANEHRRGT